MRSAPPAADPVWVMPRGDPIIDAMEFGARLMSVPPEEFTSARDALVRELRRGGRRDEAAEVAKVRRPSPALWAVNQLPSTAPDLLKEALEAAAALRKATQAALLGRRGGLAELSTTHGRLVDALTTKAMVVLASAGRSASSDTRQRIWTIIRSASSDPEAADSLAEGALLTEPASAGFDGLGGFALDAPGEEDQVAEAIPRDDLAELRAQRERERLRREAADTLEATSRRVEETRLELDDARAHVADARAALAGAERRLKKATADAEKAERALEAARQELDTLEDPAD